MACCSGVPKNFFTLNCFFSKLANLLSGLLSPEAVLSGWPHLWFSCCLVFENLLSSSLQSCPVLKLLPQAALETSKNQKKVSKIKKTLRIRKKPSKIKKTSRNRKILSKTERNLEKSKKTKKNQSGQQNVYMIPAHCPRIFGFWFFLISRGFCWFWTKSFDFLMFFRFWDRSLTSARGGKVENCLHDTSTLSQNLSISRCS